MQEYKAMACEPGLRQPGTLKIISAIQWSCLNMKITKNVSVDIPMSFTTHCASYATATDEFLVLELAIGCPDKSPQCQ